MTFKATEFDCNACEQTGVVEYYTASSIEDALYKVYYTRKLSNGHAKIGPSRRVVYSGGMGYMVTRE